MPFTMSTAVFCEIKLENDPKQYYAWTTMKELYEDRSIPAFEDRDGEMVPCEIHTREIWTCEEH